MRALWYKIHAGGGGGGGADDVSAHEILGSKPARSNDKGGAGSGVMEILQPRKIHETPRIAFTFRSISMEPLKSPRVRLLSIRISCGSKRWPREAHVKLKASDMGET